LKNKTSESNKAKMHTKETKRKIGLANKGKLKGRKLPEETKRKISQALKGKMPRNIDVIRGWHKGKHLSEEHRNKISKAHKGIIPWDKGIKRPEMSGEKHWNWKGGLLERKKSNERNDSAYNCWVKEVKKRDKNQCIFKGQSCSGYNIVHHILPWRDYPELRYEIKNGITLCQYHHPLKKDDEQRLIPFFQEMVISKAPF
jgi:hypothetical protein